MEYKGIHLHNDCDKGIVDEINRTYMWMLKNPDEDIIMDIGGNIGCFAYFAGKKGYKNLVCYEPEPSNFNLLMKNTEHLDNCEIINKAIMTSTEDNPTIDFFIPKNRRNMGSCSALIKGGRDKISVNTINFQDELNRIKPNILKIDCEGGEYDILKTPLPDYVKKITLEIHLNKKEWRFKEAPQLIELFKEWRCVREPKITEKNWHTIGKWERD